MDKTIPARERTREHRVEGRAREPARDARDEGAELRATGGVERHAGHAARERDAHGVAERVTDKKKAHRRDALGRRLDHVAAHHDGLAAHGTLARIDRRSNRCRIPLA